MGAGLSRADPRPARPGSCRNMSEPLGPALTPQPRSPRRPPAFPPRTSPAAFLTIRESSTKGKGMPAPSIPRLTTNIPEPTAVAAPAAWGPAEGLGSTCEAYAVGTCRQTHPSSLYPRARGCRGTVPGRGFPPGMPPSPCTLAHKVAEPPATRRTSPCTRTSARTHLSTQA